MVSGKIAYHDVTTMSLRYWRGDMDECVPPLHRQVGSRGRVFKAIAVTLAHDRVRQAVGACFQALAVCRRGRWWRLGGARAGARLPK